MLATTLGRFDDADARFASVSAVYERIGAPSWLGYTRIEWARMLLARRGPGDTAGAEDLLGQALTGAEQFGLPNVERRARALLEKAQ